jgi:ADP-ribosyl-[dinitrogen reductase] hydrolase
LHCGEFNPVDQMNRYVNWWQWGYYSCTGECFDIGLTTARALQQYLGHQRSHGVPTILRPQGTGR